MKIILETPRLYLREFINRDAQAFFEMNNDVDVIKYTGDLPFPSVEKAKEFIDNYDQYKKYGFGRWALCEKTSNAFLGFCGLKYHPSHNLVEVGYRLKKEYWGNGYATESTTACIEFGFKKLNQNAIYAHVHPENKASARVLERCNMKYLFNIWHENNLVHFYRKLSEKLTVKTIDTEETINIRHKVLRQGRPREDCYFPNDNLSTTVHYGIYEGKTLAGIATFLEENHPDFEGEHLQLRGMAVLDQYKAKGYGKLLLEAGEQLANQKKKQYIWCNARIIAKPFYEKMGYKTFGDSFEIPKVGTHFVMFKKIINTPN